MHSLLVIIDGLGDDPIVEFNGHTPFEYAKHENIDKLIDCGSMREMSVCENDFIPESLKCILRLLGVSDADFPENRAYLELLANCRDISEYEMVFRCNLVSIDAEGRLASFNGEGLSSEEMEVAAKICDSLLTGIEFLHLSSYRNLLIMDKDKQILENCLIAPPHESVGQDIEQLLREVKEKSILIKHLIDVSTKKLEQFNRNGISYMLYPWGASKRTVLPSFYDLHKIAGAVVCEAEIVRGIAKGLNMEIATVENCTADVDTDIDEKLRATLTLLRDNDFVLTHFNGTDEAAHRYDYRAKADFITAIDDKFFNKLIEEYKEPLRIVICGDHVTSSITGKHSKNVGPVIAAQINCKDKIEIEVNNYRDILTFLMRVSEKCG